MKRQDAYGEPKIMHFPNATVKIYSPILSPEERGRRLEIIHSAAVDLLLSTERRDIKQERI